MSDTSDRSAASQPTPIPPVAAEPESFDAVGFDGTRYVVVARPAVRTIVRFLGLVHRILMFDARMLPRQ